MITASLHRSPTGPARRSARRLCVEELTTALRLGQLGSTAARCGGELSAQVWRLYGDSRLITRSLFITVFHGHSLHWSLDAVAHDLCPRRPPSRRTSPV